MIVVAIIGYSSAAVALPGVPKMYASPRQVV